MKKIKISLKWRFTLLTVMIMTLTSVTLLIAINHDINRQMPYLKESILGNVYPTDINQSEELPNASPIVDEYIIDTDTVPDRTIVAIDSAIGETVSNIYTTSIIAFFIVIILGGITTYFVVDKALKPVSKLNENIKAINENNLTSNLQVKGPHDEVKELAISFNKMIGKLNNAFESQKRFNSSIAHELKTPLAVIKTNIDVLNSSKVKNIEDYEETLVIVEKSILKMNAMIETMLDIVRQENALLDDIVSMDEIIEDVTEDLTIIANKKHINMKVKIDNLKSQIKGNEILLYRAFYNVVENAIKYNNDGGNIDISVTEVEDNIKIVIGDNGKGIDEKHFEDIFKPFYRCEGINLSTNNGSGLGLAFTKSAISIHGGEIKVNSQLEKGTDFIITLPI